MISKLTALETVKKKSFTFELLFVFSKSIISDRSKMKISASLMVKFKIHSTFDPISINRYFQVITLEEIFFQSINWIGSMLASSKADVTFLF